MKTTVQIYPEKKKKFSCPPIESYYDADVDDGLIQYIIDNGDVWTIQISDCISDSALCRLNKVFLCRPDIYFRVYGRPYDDCNGWNLKFLEYMPNVQRLILDCQEHKDTDLSILSKMPALRSLRVCIYNLKDYSFVNSLPVHMENMSLHADCKSGNPIFDCRWLLRFQNLHSLYLGKLDRNLDCITELKYLKYLGLNNIKVRDLSFLKHTPIESLALLWCTDGKIDLSTLNGFTSLKHMELLRISKLEDISFLSTLTGLQKLELAWLRHIIKLPDMSKLHELKEITIDTLANLNDISALSEVNSLEKLRLFNVKSLPKDHSLIMHGNPNLEIIGV